MPVQMFGLRPLHRAPDNPAPGKRFSVASRGPADYSERMNRFTTGFLIGLVFFALLNLMQNSLPHGRTLYGFPFAAYTHGGLPRVEGGVDYAALWADFGVGAGFGVMGGLWFVAKARRRVNS
jgi:hypothetical protein